MPLKPIKLKKRLEEIKKDPQSAFLFAHIRLHHRWPEAEPYILKDKKVAMFYAYHVKQKHWPELEKILDGTKDMPMYNWNMRFFAN